MIVYCGVPNITVNRIRACKLLMMLECAGHHKGKCCGGDGVATLHTRDAFFNGHHKSSCIFPSDGNIYQANH